MKQALIVLGLILSQSAMASRITGSAEESCGGATVHAACRLCKAQQKTDCANNALDKWKSQCDAECVAKNRPPTRCYERNPNNDPGLPSPTCEQVGNPATDEKWKCEVTKNCTCRLTDC